MAIVTQSKYTHTHTHTENKQNKTIIMISQIEKRIRTKYGRYKDLK